MFLTSLLRNDDRLATKYTGYRLPEIPGVLFGARESSAGVQVTEDDALSLSAVFAAVNLLSRVIGSLPLVVYRQTGRDKDHALLHPAYRLLKSIPNPEMTASSFRRTLEVHRLLWGNAYAEISWAGNGNAAGLWPIEPWRVKTKRDQDLNLYFEVDTTRRVEPDDMVHVPLISFDGVAGRSFITYAIESLGLGLGTQEFAARYFGNGARPGGILRHPGNPSETVRKEAKRSWEERHMTPSKSHRVGVLWGGWEYTQDGSNNAEDAQLLEQRRFTTEEVARWFNIPPHLLRDLSRATFSNIEHQGIDFVVYSLSPVLTDYEQEYDRKLLNPPALYCKHNVAALMRGDSAARSAFYRELFGIGVLSINDILELEERNPIEGGDTHWVPLNMAPLEKALKEEDEEKPEPQPIPPPMIPEEPQPNQPLPDGEEEPENDGFPEGMASIRDLLDSCLARLGQVEINAARRLKEKSEKLDGWIDRFYPTHQHHLAETLGPILGVLAGLSRRECPSAEPLALDWCIQSKADLLSLAGRVTPVNWAAGLEELLRSWKNRPGDLARHIVEGVCHD
jgi:HK97 family phage portal protein